MRTDLRTSLRALLALLFILTVTACGGSGLRSDDPDEIISAWATIACGGYPVTQWPQNEIPSDALAVASCHREDWDPPIMESDLAQLSPELARELDSLALDGQQEVYVWKSEAIKDARMEQVDCDIASGDYYVTGENWIAHGHLAVVINPLREAGGTWCTQRPD